MHKYLRNGRGFSGLEGLLVGLLIFAITAAGYFAYQTRSKANSDNSSTAITASNNPTKTTVTPKSDKDLIIAAVTAAESKAGADPAQNTVTVQTIVGDNAKGGVNITHPSDNAGGGYAFITHKSSGNWAVIYQGQDTVCNDLGQKYGLPSDWYSTDCSTTASL